VPKFHAKTLRIWVNDGSADREISSDADDVQAPIKYDTAEATGFNENSKNYLLGQFDTPVSIKGQFNTTANRAHAVLSAIVGGTAGYHIQIMPAGSTAGYPLLHGTALCHNYSPTMGLKGIVGYQADFVPATATGFVWGTVS